MSNTITTSGGTTIGIEDEDGERVIVLKNEQAPADMRRTVAGRVIHGGFQPVLFAVWGLRPEVLRAIADLIDSEIEK
ncbi:hypothetical protein C5E11_03995 [Clavibacter michiganensis]|nr:hypothetical protein [Clavibacter michiganensis]PPF64560.1 hypothetical protein C5E11_03995 [Clavibacter michiganensis]